LCRKRLERKETIIVPSRQRTRFHKIRFNVAAWAAALALGGLAGCLDWGDDRPEAATLVLRGGQVRTMDAQGRTATAVAVRGEHIVAVGTDTEVADYIGPDTRVIELAGRTVLPGFIDAHAHPAMGAERLAQCSVGGELLTVEQMIEFAQAVCLANEPQSVPEGKWLEIANVNPIDFVATAADLDRISSTRPVALHGIDGHTEWVNTKALQLAGITAETPDPPGGEIERDAQGQPTGFLKDAAQGLVDSIIPPLSEGEKVALAGEALAMFRAKGITTVQDAWASEGALAVYEALAAQGTLKMRVRASLMSEIADDEAEYQRLLGLRARYAQHPLIQADAVKIFSDGVIEYPTQTAAMIQPYLDRDGQPTDNHGGRYFEQSVLEAYVTRLDKEGFTIHTHSIGDFTTRATLDAIQAARQANGADGRSVNRHQITHLQIVDPADFPRFAELGVIANMQLFWAEPNEWSMDAVAPYLRPETHRYMYPAGSLHAAGATLVGASDWPVDAAPDDPMPNTPLAAIQTGATRTNLSTGSPYLGHVLHGEEAVPVADMLAAYTRNAAHALRMEAKVGSVEVGKRADLVVLAADPLQVQPLEIAGIAILQTIFGGEVVHDAVVSTKDAVTVRAQRAVATLQRLTGRPVERRLLRDHATHGHGTAGLTNPTAR
jgi:predicted amidohydrolase YtcJ